jgi:Phage capsid family.
MANSKKAEESVYLKDLQSAVKECEAIRRDTEDPQDISLADYYKEKHNITMDQLYADLGLNPTLDTIQNIVNMPDPAMKWLIPEIFREALRLGLRKNPIYPSIISGEQSVKATKITMPAINMADAAPKRVGIAETIKVGEISFDQKSVSIHKIGRGIKVPYELIQYVSLNLVSLFMQDFGVKLGMGVDTMMINTLLNGDQEDGSDSAPVIGITTANTLVYRDLLRIWVRGSRMGKNYGTMIAGETAAMDILDLLVNTRVMGTQRGTVTMKTPIPQNSDIYVHGLIPNNQTLILDPSNAIIKLNAQPLLVESDKIISNQTEETYATLTTGFATIFKDSRLILDTSLAFSGNGFPTYLDPTASENVVF